MTNNFLNTKKKTFAEFLKDFRTRKNISMDVLSSKTGISKGYLSQIENGKIPSKKIIEKLAEGSPLTDMEKSIFKIELMELAGYKIIPEKGDLDWEDYQKTMHETNLINMYESEIANLKNNLSLNKIVNKDVSVKIDDVQLTESEMDALIMLILGIRETRKLN